MSEERYYVSDHGGETIDSAVEGGEMMDECQVVQRLNRLEVDLAVLSKRYDADVACQQRDETEAALAAAEEERDALEWAVLNVPSAVCKPYQDDDGKQHQWYIYFHLNGKMPEGFGDSLLEAISAAREASE